MSSHLLFSIHGVKIRATWGQTLYNPDHLLSLNNGKAPSTMDNFYKLLSNMPSPQQPIPTPDTIPPPPGRLLPDAPPTPEIVHVETPEAKETPPSSPQVRWL